MGNYVRRNYHSGVGRSWRSEFSKVGPYVGIEFECESTSSSYRSILNLLPNFSSGRRPVTECDGSLCHTRGVEIIFPPVHYNQLRRSTSVVARALKAIAPDIDTSSRATGMHMSVNCNGWSDCKILYFVATVHQLSEDEIKRLGGRYPTGYCKLTRYHNLAGYRYIGDHDQAAEYAFDREGRIELRFPAPIACHEHIRSLVNFIEQLEKFCDSLSSDFTTTPYSNNAALLGTDFKSFLQTSKKGCKVYTKITGITVNRRSKK